MSPMALTMLALVLPAATAYVGPKSAGRPSVRPAVEMRSFAEKPMKVLVAGGGIGGLILGKALEANGMEYEIFEKTAEYKPFGGPIQVQSNALAALEAIDETLANEVMEAGTLTGNRINGLKDGVRGYWLAKFDTGAPAQRTGLPLTRVVPRPALQTASLKALDRAHVHCGKDVARYEESDEGVTLFFEDGTSATGDVLVGADGIWSAVRAQMLGQPRFKDGATYSGYTCFTGVCKHSPRNKKEVAYTVFLNSGKYFVASDVGGGMMAWYGFVGQAPGLEDGELAHQDRMRVEFDGWTQEVLDIIEATPSENIERRDLYDRAPLMMKGWVTPRVALMGDAAHPMMPNLGQGGCQAIEDAYRLAVELSRAQATEDVPRALKAYESERLMRSATVQGLARIASDILFYSELLFKNEFIGRMVGFAMGISLPVILQYLYLNTLDTKDADNIAERLGAANAYANEQALSDYPTVAAARVALAEKERRWAEEDRQRVSA